MVATLGKLKKVDLREAWKHEALDFTRWLSKEENLALLSEEIGVDINLIQTEANVGSFNVDVLAEDSNGRKIVIENQLEATNHDHLGKIITYASGLDASVVVWVVASAREEHASAIEWLNKHTTSDVDFFLIEVHAYTIGDSAPAPMFKVIEQPNDFAKSVKSLANSGDLNESQVRRLEFWNMLNDALDQKGKPFNKHKATTDHWYTVAVGSSQCYISIDLVNKEHKIRVGLWVTDNKEMYDMFYSHREEIEAAFGETLDWDRLDNKKASIFSTSIPGLNFNKQDNYPELIDLAIEKTVKLREAVKPFLN